VTFAGLASADNRVAEPNLIYPLSNGTEPEILIRQMSAMGHSRTFRGGGGMSAKVPIVDINEPITALTSPPRGGYLQKFTSHLATGLGSFALRRTKFEQGSKSRRATERRLCAITEMPEGRFTASRRGAASIFHVYAG
jgi:hypothetical protein